MLPVLVGRWLDLVPLGLDVLVVLFAGVLAPLPWHGLVFPFQRWVGLDPRHVPRQRLSVFDVLGILGCPFAVLPLGVPALLLSQHVLCIFFPLHRWRPLVGLIRGRRLS